MGQNSRSSPDGLAPGVLAVIHKAAAKHAASANGDTHAEEDGIDAAPAGIHLTDLGNCQRLHKRHGADLRHCHPWKKDLIWDGRRWAVDDTAEMQRRAKDTIAALFAWAAEQLKKLAEQLSEADDDAKAEVKAKVRRMQGIIAHCLKSEAAPRLAAMVQLVRSEAGVPIKPAQLDTHPYLLNCVNGTLDLRTGVIRDHRREDYLTKLVPVAYDPKAQCPLWLKFLRQIMGGKEHLVRYLQRVVGYSLTGDVSEQCLWFLHGGGANGKSTFLLVLLAMLGDDYAIQAVSDLLMAKANETHPTERADLFGKRLVATIETDQGKHIAEALTKQLTGGDKLRARKMREDFFQFDQTHKIFLAANHKPAVRGTDLAMWRRIKMVPFEVTIPKEEQDKALPEKLKAELPGILAWAVEGCLAWQQNGMQEPDEVHQATETYRKEQDTLQRFLDECCLVKPTDSSVKTMASKLLEAYLKWGGDRKLTQKEFRPLLLEKGFQEKREASGNFWLGIGLQASDADEGWDRE